MSGTTTRRKKASSKKRGGLNGTTGAKTAKFPARKGSFQDTALKSGETVLYALGGALLGAAVGKFSVVPGLVLIGVGTHKNMPGLTTAGATMALASGYKRKDSAVNGLDGDEDNYGADGIGGLNAQNIFNGAKARVGNWLSNFSEKVPIPGISAPAVSSSSSTPANNTAANGGQQTAGLDATYDLPPLEEGNYGRPMEAVIGNVAGFNGFGNADQSNTMLGFSASL
jgi:hypothetical protein